MIAQLQAERNTAIIFINTEQSDLSIAMYVSFEYKDNPVYTVKEHLDRPHVDYNYSFTV